MTERRPFGCDFCLSSGSPVDDVCMTCGTDHKDDGDDDANHDTPNEEWDDDEEWDGDEEWDDYMEWYDFKCIICGGEDC